MRSCFGAVVAFALLPQFAAAQGALTILTMSLNSGSVGQSYVQSLSAMGGLRPYTWSVSGALPSWLTLSSDGVMSGTPAEAGVFNLTVNVTDARSTSTSQPLTLIISSGTLVITTQSLPPAVQGQSYSQTLQATGGAPPYRWSAQGLPTGLSINSAMGTISGSPTVSTAVFVVVTVTDAANKSATATLILKSVGAQVSIGPPPPLFDGMTGAAYSQAFSATGGTPPYTWSILSGDTDGLTLDASQGILQGVPANAGSFSFVLQLADSAGNRASQAYTLKINTAATPLTLITAGALSPGNVGASYSQRLPVTATGGTSPYTWSVTAGQLPPGLAFGAADQVITGTPTAAGTFTFTVQVADAAGASASRQIGLSVLPGALSITSTRALPDADLNQPYTFTAAAIGGQPPYRWSAVGLPAGLAIDANTGEISGTATAAGAFAMAITAVDSVPTTISDRFTMNVRLPAGPTATLSGLPATAPPASQFSMQIGLDKPYPVDIAGQATLTFEPDSGASDRTVQFASGGTQAAFSIPASTTSAVFGVPFALQTGSVAGTIRVSAQLQAGGAALGAPIVATSHIDRAAPVMSDVQVSRSNGKIVLAISGYSTAREVTQATFTFKPASGQTLAGSAASIVVPVDTLFGPWFQDAANGAYGSQFVYTQPFTVDGDANAVLPDTVTLVNRVGSATFTVTAK